MAKKRAAPKTRRRVTNPVEGDPPEVTDENPEVQQAREALREAEDTYRRVCHEAAERVAQARRLTVGEAIDGSLEFVRRHPVGGLCAAGLLGYLIGRILRR